LPTAPFPTISTLIASSMSSSNMVGKLQKVRHEREGASAVLAQITHKDSSLKN
jgi:hypothetical protein